MALSSSFIRGTAARPVFAVADDNDAAYGEATAVIVPVFSAGAADNDNSIELAAPVMWPEEASVAVWNALSAVGATGKSGEVTVIPAPAEVPGAVSVVVAAGLGAGEGSGEDAAESAAAPEDGPVEVDPEQLRRAAGAAIQALKGHEVVASTLGSFGMGAAVEGTVLGSYSYRGLKTDEETNPAPATVVFVGTEADRADFDKAAAIAEGVLLARDFVNAPSSHLYPDSYARTAAEFAAAAGLEVEVYTESELAEQGFGGIMGVGQGSSRKPRLLRLVHNPQDASKHVALVGKGITFDTGGISLKPGAGMEDMISDMGGSAAMIAAIVTAAKLNLPVKVTATIPMAENMPDGEAYRPGDVLTQYGGTTVEILNTDAEGRLILADGIARASEDNPDYLLETATLTGAQLVALGARTTGVMGTAGFRERVAEIGSAVGEPSWAMPFPEELKDAVKSPVADLRNVTGSRFGGMLVAGIFLDHFVGEGIKWAHLDVAGPAFNTQGAFGYTPKRATGRPVRHIVAVMEDIALHG